MNLKKEEGFTQIDIIVAVLIVMVFASVIAGLFSNLATKRNESARKCEATNLAIETIEAIKIKEYSSVTSDINIEELGISSRTGYVVNITVDNYKDYSENNGKDIKDVIKKVTVKVSYTVGKTNNDVTLSTLISII